MDKPKPRSTHSPDAPQASDAEMDEIFRKLQPDMRRPKPSADAIAAALEAAQRLAAEADAEESVDDIAREFTADPSAAVCGVCGYRNREGYKFCGMCGIAVSDAHDGQANSPALERGNVRGAPSPASQHENTNRSTGLETHHYHHHYHHHYFPGGQEAMMPRASAAAPRDPERMRPNAALRGDLSRAEASVRRITQEFVLACNTKHLDDLLDLYVADALVLRSNYPPVRGAAAVREFFFAALDAGLGEVEMEPLRVDVAGDLAYEAGRWKALIPSATGKRREERGKYLWVCARQSDAEWKLAADCWSSDLTFTTLEADVPPSAGVKTSQPRKT